MDAPVPEPRWLDEQEQAAWRASLRANHLVRVVMQEALDPYDVSLGEYEVLSMVSEAPGARIRMSVLAEMVVQSRSRISHTATRLEKRGWVERTPSTRDRRGVVLALTDAGHAQLTELAKVHVESVRQAMLDHMSHEELVQHGELMRRVVLAIRHTEDEATDAV